MECLFERTFYVRIDNDNADEHNGGKSGDLRLFDNDGAVQGEQGAQPHQQIKRPTLFGNRGKLRNDDKEEKAPKRADQRAEESTEGVCARASHVGIHADDRGDCGFGRHRGALITAQHIKQQTDRDGNSGLDDALPDRLQMKVFR